MTKVDVVFYGGSDESILAKIVEQTLVSESVGYITYSRPSWDPFVVVIVPNEYLEKLLSRTFQFAPQIVVQQHRFVVDLTASENCLK